MKLIVEMAQGKCLDVGTGDGELFAEVTRKLGNYQHDAIDIKDYRRAKPENVRFHECDALDFDTKERYDTIILHHTLEHMENSIGVLRKMVGLLAPDGRMLVAVPNYRGWMSNAHGTSTDDWSPHLYLYTVDLLRVIAGWIGADCEFLKTRLKVPFSHTLSIRFPVLKGFFGWLEYNLGRISPLWLNSQIFMVITRGEGK